MCSIKIGAVSYLNTKPLVFGFAERPELDLIFDLPSRLADRLSAGELDVALIPVIEAVANPQYTIVSDACIACRGPVRSVKLLSKVALADIQTIALDEGSRTSAALAKVILNEKFGLKPKSLDLPISQQWHEVSTDAVLVIGDRAMHPMSNSSGFEIEIDLGEYWNQWTGLPFVFAVWAARPGVSFSVVDTALASARDLGLNRIDEISNACAAGYNLTVEECVSYLTEHLHFQLGQLEKRGLALFIERAKKLLLIDQDLDLQFYDCKVTG